MASEEAGEMWIEAAADIRKRGFTFDTFMHQTYYDSLRGWAEAWAANPPNIRKAYAELVRATIPLLMANFREDTKDGIMTFIKDLNGQMSALDNMSMVDSKKRIAFLADNQAFWHYIGVHSRKTRFVPPKRETIFKKKAE